MATPCVIVAVAVLLFLNPIWVGFDQDRSDVDQLTGYTPAQVTAGDRQHPLRPGLRAAELRRDLAGGHGPGPRRERAEPHGRRPQGAAGPRRRGPDRGGPAAARRPGEPRAALVLAGRGGRGAGAGRGRRRRRAGLRRLLRPGLRAVPRDLLRARHLHVRSRAPRSSCSCSRTSSGPRPASPWPEPSWCWRSWSRVVGTRLGREPGDGPDEPRAAGRRDRPDARPRSSGPRFGPTGPGS